MKFRKVNTIHMNGLTCLAGDDELLMLLLDAPNRWLIRNGQQTAPASTLRQALRKAYELYGRGQFLGYIVKQPNDEVVVKAEQVRRLWDHLKLHTIEQPMNATMFSTLFSYKQA